MGILILNAVWKAIIKIALYGFNSAFGVLGKILKFTKIVII